MLVEEIFDEQVSVLVIIKPIDILLSVVLLVLAVQLRSQRIGVLKESVLVLVLKRGVIELLKSAEVEVRQGGVQPLALLRDSLEPLVVNDGGNVEPEVKGSLALDFDAEVAPHALLQFLEVDDQEVARLAPEEVRQLLHFFVFFHFLFGFELLVHLLPLLPREDLLDGVLLKR